MELSLILDESSAIILPEIHWLRDTILILKNQQAASTTAISWKSEHPKIDTLNKFVYLQFELTELE